MIFYQLLEVKYKAGTFCVYLSKACHEWLTASGFGFIWGYRLKQADSGLCAVLCSALQIEIPFIDNKGQIAATMDSFLYPIDLVMVFEYNIPKVVETNTPMQNFYKFLWNYLKICLFKVFYAHVSVHKIKPRDYLKLLFAFCLIGACQYTLV